MIETICLSLLMTVLLCVGVFFLRTLEAKGDDDYIEADFQLAALDILPAPKKQPPQAKFMRFPK